MHQRIAFCLPYMNEGGAAKVAAVLCSTWVGQGHEVHLLTFEEPGTEALFALEPRIQRHQLGLYVSGHGMAGFLATNVARTKRLRVTLRELEPTCVISFLLSANVVSIAATRGLGIPVIVSERNHPAFDLLSRPKALLRRITYPLADRVCVQTEDIRSWFANNLGLDCAVIENPVEIATPEAPPLTQQHERPKRIVSLGRLEPQKGFDRLIAAFALADRAVPGWQLVIHGEGPLRGALEEQVSHAGLEGRVLLPGVTRDAAGVLADCDLYAHSAHYEGFPNAVIEALVARRAVVACDCPGAIGEILRGGAYGILCADAGPDELAKGLIRAMADEALRVSLAATSQDAVRNLDPDRIARQWIAIVQSCQKARG